MEIFLRSYEFFSFRAENYSLHRIVRFCERKCLIVLAEVGVGLNSPYYPQVSGYRAWEYSSVSQKTHCYLHWPSVSILAIGMQSTSKLIKQPLRNWPHWQHQRRRSDGQVQSKFHFCKCHQAHGKQWKLLTKEHYSELVRPLLLISEDPPSNRGLVTVTYEGLRREEHWKSSQP